MTTAFDLPTAATTRPPGRTVVVLGMHRSGTSMITKIVNLLGAELGPDDALMPAHADNPTGYWENAEIVALNDDLLEALGGSWDRPPILEDGWAQQPVAQSFRGRASELIDRLGAAPTTVIKDPRMCILLPFWKGVHHIDASILVVRHPIQVAGSLATRDGMDPENAAQLWTRHVIDAWRNEQNRIVLNYDVALADPAMCAVHLADFTGLPVPSNAQLEAIRSFVDVDLHHHREDMLVPGPDMALALAVYTVVETQPFTLVDGVVEAIHAEWSERPPVAR